VSGIFSLPVSLGMPKVFGIAGVQIAKPAEQHGQVRYRMQDVDQTEDNVLKPNRRPTKSKTLDVDLHDDLMDSFEQAAQNARSPRRRTVTLTQKLRIEYMDEFEQDEHKKENEWRSTPSSDMNTLHVDGIACKSRLPWGSPLQPRGKKRDFTFSRTAFNSANTYIFECQGVLWDVADMYHHRTEAELLPLIVMKINGIIEAGKTVFFLCNKPNQSRRMVVEQLREKGIKIGMSDEGALLNVTEQNVISVGHTCSWWLKSHMSSKPYVMASYSGLLEDLRNTGIKDYVERLHASKSNCGSQDVDAVLLGWDCEATPRRISHAAHYLSKGVPLLSCCSVAERRKIEVLGNGTQSQVSGTVFPKGAPATDLRMPSPAVLDALKAPVKDGGYGIDFNAAVWIGCSLDNSVRFAHSGGMRCLLICNELDKIDLALESRASRLPDWCLPTFADV